MPAPRDEADRRDPTEQVLDAEQDERRRIALFLHDGPVQSLAGIALLLDAGLDLVTRGETEQAREVIGRALERTRMTVGELRNLSFNLEPVVLRDHGFVPAVKALTQDRGIEHGIQVEIDADGADALGLRAQAALYQIVREALEGAIRRGPPTRFSITVGPAGSHTVEAVIADDAPPERRKRSVEVLEERARTLDATLTVEPTDEGTTMRLVLPAGPSGD